MLLLFVLFYGVCIWTCIWHIMGLEERGQLLQGHGIQFIRFTQQVLWPAELACWLTLSAFWLDNLAHLTRKSLLIGRLMIAILFIDLCLFHCSLFYLLLWPFFAWTFYVVVCSHSFLFAFYVFTIYFCFVVNMEIIYIL